jgi:hypothetical protein
MTIGRNDPCPCGSGRKFKKCHGAAEREPVSAEAARSKALKARDVDLGERLLRFARVRHGQHWLHDVFGAESFLKSGGIPDEEMPLLIPWLMHLRQDGAGLTLAEEWRREQRRLSPDDRLLLDAYEAAWVSLWEATEVEPGTGSRLRDVLTGEERFVRDIRSSSSLQRFDTLLAIVLTCEGTSFFGGLHVQPLPPRFAEAVVRDARRLCRVRSRPVAPEKLRDPNMQLELLALWRAATQARLEQPPPALQNTDGDPLQLTRDEFTLLAPRADVARRLASLPGAQEPEPRGDESVFTIVKPGNPVHRSWDNTVIGAVTLSATRLRAETNSTRRADSLRAAIETHLAGQVRFRLRAEENTAQLLAKAQAASATREPPTDEAIPPEALTALRQFREQHLRDWIDDSLPALDGLTPREAALRPGPRRKLEVLLKEFERSEANLPEQERIDLRWVWEALGFP